MEFVNLTKQEYRQFFDSCTYKNFWASVEMADMREHKGWKIHYIGVKDNNKIRCACALESLNVYRKYKLFMALRGFLIDYHEEALLTFFLQNLTQYLNDHDCLYMKLDPYIAYQPHDLDGNAVEGEKEDRLIKILADYGFVHQGFRIHHEDEFEPRWMSVLDVQGKCEEELLKQMSSMTRRNINAAMKNGVKLKTLKREELSVLEKVVEDTGNRKHFNKPDLTYYEQLYDCFKEHVQAICAYLDTEDYIARIQKEMDEEQANKTKMEESIVKNPEAKKTQKRLVTCLENIKTLEARYAEALDLQKTYGKEIPLAASLFIIYPNEIIYLFGGSYSDVHKFKGSYAIQWHMIKETLQLDIPRYNFYGISGNFDKNAEDYGVYLFKKGFHADVIELIGDFIYVGNAAAYKQYQMLRKIKHRLLRS